MPLQSVSGHSTFAAGALLRVLVVAETAEQAAELLAYIHQVASPLSAHVVIGLLAPPTPGRPAPLPVPAAPPQVPGSHTIAIAWSAELPLRPALRRVIEQHRVTLVVARHPYASGKVPRRHAATPVLQLLMDAPCALLLQVRGAAAVPRAVLAVSDGKPNSFGWSGRSVRTLLVAWRAPVHPVVLGRPPRVRDGVRQLWRELVADEALLAAGCAIPAPTHLGGAIAASQADLVVLALPSNVLARRVSVLAALHSPVSTLLVPTVTARTILGTS